MKPQFDDLKRKLSKEEQPLPQELNWEEMQGGIFEKMQALEAAEAESNSTRKNTIRIGIGLLLLLLLPLTCHFLKTKTTQEKPVATHQSEAVSEGNLQNNNAKTQLAEKAKINTETNLPSGTNDIQASDNQRFEKRDQLNKTEQQKTGEIFVAPPNTDWSETLSTTSSAVLEKQPTQTTYSTVALLPNKLASMVSSERNRILDIDIPTTPFTVLQKDKQHFTAQNELFVLTGATFWHPGYGKNAPERDAFETPLSSFHSGINYVHTFPNRLHLFTGLDYQQLDSRLDWESIVDDFEVEHKNIVLRVRTNLLTDDHEEIKGDSTYLVDALRVVRHYNRTQIVQLPVGLGRTWTAQKWQAHFTIGSSFTLFTQHKGRTILNAAVQDYNGSTTDFMDNRLGLQPFVRSSFSYALSKHIGLAGGLQFQKSLTDWSTEQQITVRPAMLNIDLGLVYRFE